MVDSGLSFSAKNKSWGGISGAGFRRSRQNNYVIRNVMSHAQTPYRIKRPDRSDRQTGRKISTDGLMTGIWHLASGMSHSKAHQA
jgi:hypothetical protein